MRMLDYIYFTDLSAGEWWSRKASHAMVAIAIASGALHTPEPPRQLSAGRKLDTVREHAVEALE